MKTRIRITSPDLASFDTSRDWVEVDILTEEGELVETMEFRPATGETKADFRARVKDGIQARLSPPPAPVVEPKASTTISSI